MTAIYRLSGDAVPYTPSSAAVDAGAIVVQGALVGITKHKIEKDQLGTLFTSGIFEGVPKNGSGALTVGQIVYVNPSNGKIYASSAATYIPCGYAIKAAASADTTCTIMLCPGVNAAAS